MFACVPGCFMPETGSEERDGGIQPPDNLFGGDAGMVAGDAGLTCSSGTPLVSMRVRVRTTTANGRYSPRNIGAIWIETEGNAFVKTVERWAGTRARWLTKFNAASASNLVDAVTGATLLQHTTHDRTWNLTDRLHCEVVAGNYRVVVEMTDKNGAGPSTVMPFTIDGTPMTLTFPDATNFHDLSIELK
jgi:hypothetical protein